MSTLRHRFPPTVPAPPPPPPSHPLSRVMKFLQTLETLEASSRGRKGAGGRKEEKPGESRRKKKPTLKDIVSNIVRKERESRERERERESREVYDLECSSSLPPSALLHPDHVCSISGKGERRAKVTLLPRLWPNGKCGWWVEAIFLQPPDGFSLPFRHMRVVHVRNQMVPFRGQIAPNCHMYVRVGDDCIETDFAASDRPKED